MRQAGAGGRAALGVWDGLGRGLKWRVLFLPRALLPQEKSCGATVDIFPQFLIFVSLNLLLTTGVACRGGCPLCAS